MRTSVASVELELCLHLVSYWYLIPTHYIAMNQEHEEPPKKSICEKPRKRLPKKKMNKIFWIKKEREPEKAYKQFGDLSGLSNLI